MYADLTRLENIDDMINDLGYAIWEAVTMVKLGVGAEIAFAEVIRLVNEIEAEHESIVNEIAKDISAFKIEPELKKVIDILEFLDVL